MLTFAKAIKKKAQAREGVQFLETPVSAGLMAKDRWQAY